MTSYIDGISKITSMLQAQVERSRSQEKSVAQTRKGPVFNDLLIENIEKNKENKGRLTNDAPLSSEKLKLLVELIQLQFKSAAFSNLDESGENISYLSNALSLFNFPDNGGLIDSLVSNIKQPKSGIKGIKAVSEAHKPEKKEILPKSHPIEQVIDAASNKYNIDPDLIRSVIRAESGFDPGSTSSKGAMGLMQLMPETAEELGVNNPYDIFENVMGGTGYLKTLLDRYDGNTDLALAAYNWGMGNVERNPEGLPRETMHYISRINKFLKASKV